MKRFLLIAIAALTVGAANAQLVKKQAAGKPQTQHQMTHKASVSKKYELAGAKAGVKAVQDKFSSNAKQSAGIKDLKPVIRQFKASRRAAELQPVYEGFGMERSSGNTVTWNMTSGTVTTDDATLNVLKNIIPNPFGFDEVLAEYTFDPESSSIIVKPQLVASGTDDDKNPIYIFLESATSADGSITFTLDETGHITGSYSIIYSVYPNEIYNFDEWMYTYEGYSGVKYNLPGEDVTPDISFESANLVLFAGLGLSGYSYNSNLAMTGAYATTNFANRTTDKVTAWNWSAIDASSDEEGVVYATGKDFDFPLSLKGGDAVGNVQLVATNNTKIADPFIFGAGKYLDEGAPHYENCYIYAGESAMDFEFSDGSTAIMTRQDPDGHLKFYTNWGTPDIAGEDYSMSKIYCYHEKPAAPLYITGVTLPMVNFTAKNNFELHIKICKVTWPNGRNGRPQLGEVLAEGDASGDNVNAEYSAGLTAVEFTELYRDSEDGLGEDIEYLFLEDEFMIVIEGWDNGTFSGVLGSQDAPLETALTSTWFEKSGNEGSMYSYTSWKTSLFVGLLGATYGWLYTEDNTNVTLPVEGGQTALHIQPYLCNSEESESMTRLWLDYSSEEIPDWLKVSFANEDYVETNTFDLAFEAEPLPAGVESRQANLVFCQEGGLLKVTITQGASAGIKGDVNGDGQVGIGDIICVTNYMAGHPGEITLEQADVNGDGEVGIGDIISITNIMAGTVTR